MTKIPRSSFCRRRAADGAGVIENETFRLFWDNAYGVHHLYPDEPASVPDMIGLCTGLTGTGTGAEGTVKGARVLVSTAELSRSIAVILVRHP